MRKTLPRRMFELLATVAVVGLALGVRWLLDTYLGETTPYLTSFAATVVAVWIGGLPAALLASVLGYVFSQVLFVEPRGHFVLFGGYGLAQLIGYALTSAMITAFGVALHAARARAEANARRADEQSADLAAEIARRAEVEARLRESEASTRLLLDAVEVLMWIADADGILRLENRSWRTVTGRESGGEMNWSELLHPGDAPHVAEVRTRHKAARQPYEVEARLRRRDGQYRWHLIRVVPFDAGRWVGTATDIHDLKTAQESLRRSEEALRDADRRKDEFLAMLAHELRNPLAPVRTAVELLRVVPADDPARARSLTVIERQVEHLRRMLDDLLDVARFTRGKLELRRAHLDLAAVVNDAIESTRPIVEARRHLLAVRLPERPLRVDGDLTRLAQVVANLLHNAAKYTPEGGHIELTVERRGDDAVLRVADDGVGMTQEMLAHAFDLFAQAERTIDRSQGGLGIGLTLVKRIVELHGGRVDASSPGPGRGTVLEVMLPLVDAGPDESLPDGTPTPRAGGPLRVLVVDDNRDAAESLALLLQLLGHQTRPAFDGPEALEACAAIRPHALILDLGLPGMDGFAVAREVRQRFGAAPFLVALTGYGQEEDRRKSRDAGFDAHLVKPVDLAEVQRTLDALPVERRRA